MSAPEASVPQDRLQLSDLFLVFLLVYGGVFLLPAFLGFLQVDPASDALTFVVLLYGFQYVWMLAVTLAVARGLRGLSWRDLGFRAPPPNWLPGTLACTLLALASAPVVNYIVYVVYELVTGEIFVNPQVQALSPRGGALASYITMLLVAGLLAPFVEETLFRGLVYSWLRRRTGFMVAALVSAFFFSLAHLIVALVPALFVVGLILAWVYERYQSLLPVMLLHGIFNASMLTLLYVAIASGADTAQP